MLFVKLLHQAAGALGEDNDLIQQEFLEQIYKQGEFTHDSSNPFLNFVSSVLDITIIKPIIEACTGEDLITGEDLTDLERGLKLVFAMVNLVTLGGAIAATKFSEMGLKEGLKAFGKTALIDFAGNTAACGVGALGEAFDWPVPVTMMLSLAAGITISISGNKLLFKNTDGVEIGSKTLSDAEVKKIGDVRGTFKGGSETVENTLPNLDKAVINPNKLTGYALNPEHPVGGNKAKVFESALGYNKSNADDLIQQVYEKLPQNEAILGTLDQYDQRYTVNMPITGPNGNTVNVRTGWIIKTGSDAPELTTIYVK